MTRIEDLLGDWVVKHRWWIILLTVPAIGLAASGIRRLHINNDTRVFFGEHNPQYRALKALENTFSKEQSVLFIVAPKDGNVFTRSTLTVVAELTDAGWQIPYSARVNSVSNFQYTRGEDDDLIVEALIGDPNAMSDDQIDAAREVALSEQTIINRLISPSGHVAGVFVGLSMPSEHREATPKVAQAATDILEDVRRRYPGIDFYLTGSVMVDQAFGEASKKDFATLAPAMFITMAVLIGLTLRSFFGVLAALVVIGLSMLMGLGLAGWLGIPLTAASASGPGLILTLAVADCVHILSTMLHLMREGMPRRTAIVRALQINLQAVFLTSITTVIGFLSLNFSESPPFRDLGNMVGLGVTAAFLCSILLLPALMAVLPCGAGPDQKNHIRIHCDKLAGFVIRRSSVLLWSMLTLGAVTSLGMFRIELNDNFLTYFDDSFAFRRATDFLIENLGGWDIIEYPLSSGQSGGVVDPDYLTTLDRFAQWYRQQPKVIHVGSIADTMKRLNRDMHGGDEAYYRIPDSRELGAQYLLFYELSLPFGHDLTNVIDVDRDASRLTVMFESMSAKELHEIDEKASQWLKANAPPSMQISGVGLSLIWAEITHRNIRSMLKGSLGALLLISIIMTAALRNLKLGLISLVPNLVPPAMAFGVWGFLNGQVGLALSVVVAMTIGIVVDDTVHFLSKYERARREQGMNPSQAVRYAFQTVGTAMWVTTVALVAGFSLLTLSRYRMSSEMGQMCAIVIGLALLMDYLLLPSLLLKTDREDDTLGAVEKSKPNP
ncbi:MAG: efflux RND transporter permease subunit [Sedimentisphaerales bacterium]|jgi:predicted RND superfamily exporter protein|nr:efflux RND transporter permease subunit [Sedimentisphaerales bacterium]NLT77425.1 MMPL family transporter [Planctomycetota bacterium]